MSYIQMSLLPPNHSLQTGGSPEVITSTTIVRNVVKNQLGKAGTPNPESSNRVPHSENSMSLLPPNNSLQTRGSPEVITSTTILRNVVKNQLGKAGTPNPESSNRVPHSENSKRFSCHGLLAGTVQANSSHHRFEFRVSFSQVSCLPRQTCLSYPWVYYRSSPLLGGLPTKAIEPHLPGVSQSTLHLVPAVTLSIWLIACGGRSRTRGLCHSVWSSPIPATSDCVDPIYPHCCIINQHFAQNQQY